MKKDIIILREMRGRIEIEFNAITLGEDICVVIKGGDTPHIGAIAFKKKDSYPQDLEERLSAEIISLPGHREAEVIEEIVCTLASSLNKNVAVCCGIHIDNATKDEISVVIEMLTQLTAKLIGTFKAEHNAKEI